MDVREILDLTATWPPSAVYGALFGGALIEYVFPPFPGDTLVVAGAALIGANGWAVAPIWIAVTLGSVVGGAADLAVGRWLARGRLDRLSPRSREAVDRLVEQFRRYGAVYLAFNRFLPGVRPLFFVAAGLAGLRTAPVLGWATLSAVVWNTGLVLVGIAVGDHVDRLQTLLSRYQLAVGIALVGIAAIVVGRGLRRWWSDR